MTEEIFFYSIVGVAVSAAFAFLVKGTGKIVPKDEAGRFNLRMNKLYGIMGVVGLLVGFAFVVVLPLTVESIDNGMTLAIALMLLIFWGTGIPCFMYYKNHSVSFDNHSIRVTNVYGKTNEILWSDVSAIRFKALSGLLAISTGEKTVHVHQHLVGLTKFMEYIEDKTRWTRENLDVPVGK